MTTMNSDVLIIGAGSSGLAAAYELKKRNIEPTIIDGADRVGSSWSRRHEQLHLNTHRAYSGQPGVDIPKEYGAHVRRDDYINYLEDYAASLDLPINFGVSAKQINANGGAGWQVETDQGVLSARHVIVATGPERRPFTPKWPGMELYEGELIHAADFGRADDYIGKHVLIVGGGNSGSDIANHLASVAISPSWISVRTGPTVAPEYALGLSAHQMLMWLRWLPVKAQDFMVAMLGRVFVGDLRQYGLPAPPVGAVTRGIDEHITLAIDNGFVKALKTGRLTIVPVIESFNATSVKLVDGRTLEPDVIICATGYRPGLEPLVGHLGVLDEHGKPRFVADDSSPKYPGLWFFGLNHSIYGYMFMRKKEAPRLAEKISQSLNTAVRIPPAAN